MRRTRHQLRARAKLKFNLKGSSEGSVALPDCMMVVMTVTEASSTTRQVSNLRERNRAASVQSGHNPTSERRFGFSCKILFPGLRTRLRRYNF